MNTAPSTEALAALLAQCDELLVELTKLAHQAMVFNRRVQALREEVVSALKTPPI
jgi:hypothetical protein